jgi:signal transduction histidine kinase
VSGVFASVLSDNATLVLLTFAGSAPVLLTGAWLTRRDGGERASMQVLVVALAPLMATWIGALVAARAMFINSHDLTALGVIAAAAAVVGVAASWRLTRRIRRDTTALEEMSRSIAAGATPTSAPDASVSELGRLGEQLGEMSRELAESHRRELALEHARRELVAWVSHDLRSPLAGIRAMAEAIEDGIVEEPDDVRHYLRSIGSETDRLTLLVDDLFELSRITSGSIDLTPTAVAVDEFVGRVVDGVRPAARARGLELDCQLETDEPLLVSPAEATRVLRNLLDNAVRYTPTGGRVRVRVTSDAHHTTVSVVDECGGIPTDDLDRVFEVAFRGDAARGREDPASPGAGLGLAIARGLAEAQAGSIDVANHSDGCCFSVRFPVVPKASGDGDDVDDGDPRIGVGG